MQPHGEFFADKIMDLANLGVAALIFGQFIEGEILFGPLMAGIGLFVACGVLSYFLRRA